MPLPPFNRHDMLARLAESTVDVIVIGGGITGVGVALDAATRGLSVALVDKGDLASGTSSKSSKLAHGGLRYLQQGEIGLVYEALHERQRLLRNAPHLVRTLPFLIPVTSKGGVVSRKIGWALGKVMWMYDLTGGFRIGKLHKRIDSDEVLRHAPTMPAERLAYGFVYYDATVDDARLALAVARTAAAHGAIVATYAPVTAIEPGTASAPAVITVAPAGGPPLRVSARVVVNAAGVWADNVRALGSGVHDDTIRPAKGIHLTFAWDKVRNDIALVIPVPGDKRSLFVVPWLPNDDGTFQLTYVGTTDTDYDGPLDDPVCTPEDVAYVIKALNASITTGVTLDDIVGSWAGLRPLVRSASSARTADLSRGHSITTSPEGIVSVAGGKLTTYRRMAADTVDVVMRRLGRRGRSVTSRTALVGADGERDRDRDAANQRVGRDHLSGRYGNEAPAVQALITADASLGEPLVPGLPYLRAEAVHAVRHEMATTLADVLDRRTRARLQARAATRDAADAVARLIAPELGWDDARVETEVAAYRAELEAEANETVPPAVDADQAAVVDRAAVDGARVGPGGREQAGR